MGCAVSGASTNNLSHATAALLPTLSSLAKAITGTGADKESFGWNITPKAVEVSKTLKLTPCPRCPSSKRLSS